MPRNDEAAFAPVFFDRSQFFVSKTVELYAQLEVQRTARRGVEERLRVARAKEQAVIQKRRETLLEENRKEQCVIKLQRFFRGWRVRKMFISSAEHEHQDHVTHLAAEPDRLKDQLQQLQHSVHDMVFTTTDRELSAIRIQAIWRKCLAKRVVHIMIVNLRLRDLCRCIVTAATMIQSAYRRYVCHVRFHTQIRVAMELSRQKQRQEAQRGLKAIRGLQKAFRSCLARRRAQRRRQELGMATELRALRAEHGLANNYMPIDANKSPLLSDRDGPPRTHREIEKLEDAGLIPFYWSTKSEKMRHKIGGPAALKIQKLTLSVIENNEIIDGEIDLIGELWDMYPEGVSTGFANELDSDVWPLEVRQKRAKRQDRKQRTARAAQRSTAPNFFMPPPSNTEWRATRRLEAQNASQRANPGDSENNDGTKDDDEAHPLLANVPCHLPRPPPQAAQRALRPHSQTRAPKTHNDEADGSWANATSFYDDPRCPKQQSQRPERVHCPWLTHPQALPFDTV